MPCIDQQDAIGSEEIVVFDVGSEIDIGATTQGIGEEGTPRATA